MYLSQLISHGRLRSDYELLELDLTMPIDQKLTNHTPRPSARFLWKGKKLQVSIPPTRFYRSWAEELHNRRGLQDVLATPRCRIVCSFVWRQRLTYIIVRLESMAGPRSWYPRIHRQTDTSRLSLFDTKLVYHAVTSSGEAAEREVCENRIDEKQR